MSHLQRIGTLLNSSPEFAGEAWIDADHDTAGVGNWAMFVVTEQELELSFWIQAHPIGVARLVSLLNRSHEPFALLESYDYLEDGDLTWESDWERCSHCGEEHP